MRNRKKEGTNVKISLSNKKSTYAATRPSGTREVGVNTATSERSGGETVPSVESQVSIGTGEWTECQRKG